MPMTAEKAQELRAKWEAGGSKDCPHLRGQKEYEGGESSAYQETGNFICMKCGALVNGQDAIVSKADGLNPTYLL